METKKESLRPSSQDIFDEAPKMPEGPKPVSARISTMDVRVMFATGVGPEGYNQCILAALKDAGAPVEGVLRLKLAHGAVAKVLTSPLEEQDYFEYLWLPEQYVRAIAELPPTGANA